MSFAEGLEISFAAGLGGWSFASTGSGASPSVSGAGTGLGDEAAGCAGGGEPAAGIATVRVDPASAGGVAIAS